MGGFGDSGVPFHLLNELSDLPVRNLTVVSNNCGTGERGLAALFKAGLVSKIVASFPVQPGNEQFRQAYESGLTELELVPQGTLVERLRAGAAGLGGVLTPTGVGSKLSVGKPTYAINQHDYLVEEALRGDVALVRARVADPYGNLRFWRAARNFNPVMAMAADYTIAEVDEIVEVGMIDPDDVHTPGVFVDAVVVRGVVS